MGEKKTVVEQIGRFLWTWAAVSLRVAGRQDLGWGTKWRDTWQEPAGGRAETEVPQCRALPPRLGASRRGARDSDSSREADQEGGHGNKQESILSRCRAVLTELDRTEVFLIYTQLCMDPDLDHQRRNSVLVDLRACNRDFSCCSHNGLTPWVWWQTTLNGWKVVTKLPDFWVTVQCTFFLNCKKLR